MTADFPVDTVTLVFLDGHRKTVTISEAWEICDDRQRARAVLDALTDDTKLQARLREHMDRY